MTKEKIIIDGVDVSKCYRYQKKTGYCEGVFKLEELPFCENFDYYFKQLKHKEQECKELHARTASIIYNLTGGRLSYSTYTLEGCEDAYRDRLRMDVERATKELEEENDILKSENFTFKELIKTQGCEIDKYKQVLDEIEEFCITYSDNHDAYETVYKDILEIINEAKAVSNAR